MVSCDEDSNPTDPGSIVDQPDSGLSTVIITAIDEFGKPVEDVFFNIEIEYLSGVSSDSDSVYESEEFTDAQGTLIFQDIMPGNFMVSSIPEEYEGKYNFVQYEESRELEADTIHEITFMFPREPVTIKVEIRGEMYGVDQPKPLDNVGLNETFGFNKGTPRGLSDENGILYIDNVPVEVFEETQNWDFEREGTILYTVNYEGSYCFENDMIVFRVTTFGDLVAPVIVTPENEAQLAGNVVHLSGYGYDFEDGYLPDSLLTWISFPDGVLGNGSELTAELSSGEHQITLQARELGSEKPAPTYTYIKISVSHYAPESYFPLPYDGYWKYHYTPLSFIIINILGQTEHWTLSRMRVTTESLRKRVCNMVWNIEQDGIYRICDYTIEDTIEVEGTSLQITSTEEYLYVSAFPDSIGDPIEELTCITDYSPSYPLLHDFRDPSNPGYTETEIIAQSNIESYLPGVGSHTHQKNETIKVTYDPGLSVILTTPSGTYETVPVTSNIGSVERTLYLAPGIGMVQLDTDIAGVSVTASLLETNMESYRETYAASPRVMRHTVQRQSPAIFSIASGEDRLMQIRQILMGIRPM